MIREWGVRAGAALIVAAIAGAAAWVGTRGGPPPPPLHQFEARAELDPRTHLFGDPVTARLDVELDTRLVDPASVRVVTRFRPYSVAGVERDVGRAGDVVVLRHRFRLLCLAPACTPRGAPLELSPAPARVRYRLRAGSRRTVTAPWPPSFVMTRISGAQLPSGADPRAPWPWRWPAAPPAVSYRAAPTLVAGIAYTAAAALALLAAFLLAPELRRLLRLAARREDPLAGLSPLERAVALLERALASGAAADQRKALDRLARELRRRGEDGLAGDARRLAWSAPAPGDEVRALRGAVARALGGRT